jgi:hypothetical protein
MKASESQLIRQELQKTQKQMSEFLGIFLKGLGFEQGSRIIPPYVESQDFVAPLKENGDLGMIGPSLGNQALSSRGGRNLRA